MNNKKTITTDNKKYRLGIFFKERFGTLARIIHYHRALTRLRQELSTDAVLE